MGWASGLPRLLFLLLALFALAETPFGSVAAASTSGGSTEWSWEAPDAALSGQHVPLLPEQNFEPTKLSDSPPLDPGDQDETCRGTLLPAAAGADAAFPAHAAVAVSRPPAGFAARAPPFS